jgi:hypothetical protein
MELAAAAAKSVSAWDQPGTLGFLVVFGMAIILFFVFRSLAKHLRKINEAARVEASEASRETGPDGTEPGGTRATGSGRSSSGQWDPDHDRQQSEANAAMMDLDL